VNGNVTADNNLGGRTISADGGAPGSGSIGGTAQQGNSGATKANPGGIGGNGGTGGAGGSIKLSTTGSGDVDLADKNGNAITISADGVAGQTGATGGQGGFGSGIPGGNGGKGGNGGNGGNGGKITLTATGSGNYNPPSTPVPQPTGGAAGGAGVGGPLGSGTPDGTQGPGGTGGKAGNPGKVITAYEYDDSDDDTVSGGKRRSKRYIATGSASDSHMQPVAFASASFMMGTREIESANLLVMPKSKDQVVTVGETRIHVAKGSAAFVVHNGAATAVLCLHEDSVGDVSVLLGEREITLSAGEQLTLNGNPVCGIAVRNLHAHGDEVFTSDFSLPSAMANLAPVKQLSQSVSRDDRAMFAKMLKNAAALQTLGLRKGAYKASL
jgi:hypothetical protein